MLILSSLVVWAVEKSADTVLSVVLKMLRVKSKDQNEQDKEDNTNSK